MAWYWIVLIVVAWYCAPFGLYWAHTAPDSFAKHPIIDAFDLFVLLALYLMFCAMYAVAGWGFALYYLARHIRASRKKSNI
jgi:hypothetical protein